ncbi:DeoR family transcriptional regulator [Rummeliibacillus sp. JY-2-4R]
MNNFKEARHQYILDLIKVNKRVYVAEIANHFRVSPETIRRDLHELEMMQRVSRFHGGAVAYKKKPIFNKSGSDY